MTITRAHVFKLFVVSLAFFLFFVGNARTGEAYFTTGQRAVNLGNGTGVFLVDFVFGTKSHEIHMPVMAEWSTTTPNDAITFSIINNDGEEAAGTAAGIVLSDTILNENGFYVTPKNAAKTFTLAVFFTEPATEAPRRYHLKINHLPFMFDGTQQLQLNPSELEPYRTRSIGI